MTDRVPGSVPVAEPFDLARVEASTILRAEVGSGAHGITIPGTDDRDEMGVCVEPPEFVIGFRRFEQIVRRDRPEGVRSQPGDLDLVIYGLRKFVGLALKGNPSVLLLLFVSDENCTILTPAGAALRAVAPLFASKHGVKAFLRYMERQRERMTGSRGQKNVKRPELVEAYGYDTKYAGHVARLGYQGIEYARTGRFSVPLLEEQREVVLAIRRGDVAEKDALRLAVKLEADLEAALALSPLPDEPNREKVEEFLVAVDRRRVPRRYPRRSPRDARTLRGRPLREGRHARDRPRRDGI